MLEVMATICGVAPFYLTAAAFAKDPIERMKFVMCYSIAYIHPTHIFEKPVIEIHFIYNISIQLNPILGETYQGECPDGTRIYMEQTQHRPPVTSLTFEGPDGLWEVNGWASWQAKAWLNSAALIVEGHKTITFHDGGEITFSNSSD